MARYYFDTSALVKYYIIERGTNWVKALIDARLDEGWEHVIITVILSVVEVTAAFARRRRMKEISKGLYAAILSRFLREGRRRYTLIDVNESIINLAAGLAQRHPLRAYDAVQLATALIINRALVAEELPPLVFVSADDVLCEAARAEGLEAENPTGYGAS
jgi:hypothetical protein